MRPLPAVAAAAAVALLFGGRSRRWRVAGVTVLVLVHPALAATTAAAVGAAVAGARRLVTHRERQRAEADVATLARSLLVCLSAGLALDPALALGARHVHPILRAEVEDLRRRARRIGLSEALTEADGFGSRLFRRLAAGQRSGASTYATVADFVEERRESDRLRALEAARRLPVRLTVPLALLILPGFVLLTAGPSVLEMARRLLGPVASIP